MRAGVTVLIVAAGCFVSVAVANDVRVLDHVVQQDVKVGGFWRTEFRKLSVKWLPHCIRQMEKQNVRGQSPSVIHWTCGRF